VGSVEKTDVRREVKDAVIRRSNETVVNRPF